MKVKKKKNQIISKIEAAIKIWIIIFKNNDSSLKRYLLKIIIIKNPLIKLKSGLIKHDVILNIIKKKDNRDTNFIVLLSVLWFSIIFIF